MKKSIQHTNYKKIFNIHINLKKQVKCIKKLEKSIKYIN